MSGATPTVGYVGLDHHHCPLYLESLERLPAEVVCACEPNPEFDPPGIDELDDVPVYGDLEEVLTADVDAIWVTLPNRNTPNVIERAVEAGIDVYTEKPAARTAAELEPLVETVKNSEATVMVSYTWRGHPIPAKLREHSRRGFFGDVRSFSAQFIASALDTRDPDHYLYDAAASRGGILQWLGIHWVDLLPWILDDPIARVNASTQSNVDGVDVEDGATLQVETESGVHGSIDCGYYLRDGQYDTQIDIYGTAGESTWDPIGREFGFDDSTDLVLDSRDPEWTGTPRRTITYDYDPAPGYGGAWGTEFMRSFFEARESDEDVPVDLRDAVRVLRVLDAAYDSADGGGWITVDA